MPSQASDLDIPRSAESVIEKRLLRLDPAAYRVLEYASAEGDRFSVPVIARVLGVPADELRASLDAIAYTHQLVRAEPDDIPVGEVFSFSHTIVQDVLHNNLQPRRRILLHRRIAEVLEQEHGADPAQIAHRLAIHYDEGRARERAYEFSVLAAEAAAGVFAFGDAVDLFQRALRNARIDEQRAHVFTRVGHCYRQMARLTDSSDAYFSALDLLAGIPAAAVRRELIYVQRDLGSRAPELLMRDVQELEQEVRGTGDAAELCRVLWTYRMLPAQPSLRETRMREALRLASSTGADELIARGQFELGYTLMADQNPRAAIPHLQDALALHERRGELVNVGLCYNCLAISHALLGETATAVEMFDRAAASFKDARTPANVASVRNNRGALLTHLGNWDAAELDLRESLKLAERMGAGARVLHPLENLGRLFHEKEDWATARVQWQLLLERARRLGYWTAEVIAQCGLGTVELEQGRLTAADEAMREAEAVLRKDQGWTESRVEWQLLAARIALAEGDRAGAVRLLEEVAAALSPRDRFRCAIVHYHRAEALLPLDAAATVQALKSSLANFPAGSVHPKRLRAERILQQMEISA